MVLLKPGFLLGDACDGSALEEGFESGSMPYGWRVYDLDEDGQNWTIGKDPFYAHSGNYFIQVSSNNGDDWLITPRSVVAEGDSFTFWAKSHYYNFLDDFEVLVSATDNVPDSFTVVLDSVNDVPSDWTYYSYSLDNFIGSEIFLAIRCLTTGSSHSWMYVDDISGPQLWVPPYPIASFSRDSIQFVGRLPGQTGSENLSLINYGGVDLNITDLVIDNPVFEMEISSLITEPCSSSVIPISFTPDTIENYTGNLIITSNALTSPDTVPLNGRGINTFFPHHAGDVWEYLIYDGDSRRQIRILSDSTTEYGSYVRTIFQEFNSPYPYTYYEDYLIDTLYNVYKLDSLHYGNEPVLWYKFNAQPGEWWVVNNWNETYFELGVLDSTFNGYFWGEPVTYASISYYTTFDTTDTEDWIWGHTKKLASGFGLVRIYGEAWPGAGLVGAVLDGVLYGDTTNLSASDNYQYLIPGFTTIINYPNPFNSRTTIRIDIKESTAVSLKLFDLAGNQVYTFWENKTVSPGVYFVDWNGINNDNKLVSSGIYFLVIQNGAYVLKRALSLIK